MLQFVRCSVALPDSKSRVASKLLAPELLLANDQGYLGLGQLVSSEQGQHWALVSGQTLPLEAVTQWAWLSRIRSAVDGDEALVSAENGPSNYAFRLLRTWNSDDPLGWFQLARRVWHFKDFFAIIEEADRWVISLGTAGWSDNEALVRAMQANEWLWLNTWRSYRAGGHYEFEIRKELEDADASCSAAHAA